LADPFDRTRFAARLGTCRLGRELRVLDTTASTNDDAWSAFAALPPGAAGRADGVVAVALEQTRGRGRAGRAWTQVPGRGLALSLALPLTGDARHAGAIPLAAGLALVEASHALGVGAARLKWPNDVRVHGRKLAGVLCEARGTPAGVAVVIGVGLNVHHAREEFPPELRDTATSLALEGATAGLEDAAAAFLTRFAPLWDALSAGEHAAVLAAWSRWCEHWGQALEVRTPAGPVAGTALRLSSEGGLVLRTNAGVETTVFAGDIAPAPEGCDAA
jgi:BirA family biotin operon repressor/biotin-[acetyl-CoA-carboxylase] ligase